MMKDPVRLEEKLVAGGLDADLLEIAGGNGHNSPEIHYRVDYKGQRFYLTVKKDLSFLYVGAEEFDRDFVRAASNIVKGVVNDKPSIRYKERDGCIALEWCENPEERYKELKGRKNQLTFLGVHLSRIVSKLRGTFVSIW
jgi:hypothetical protein